MRKRWVSSKNEVELLICLLEAIPFKDRHCLGRYRTNPQGTVACKKPHYIQRHEDSKRKQILASSSRAIIKRKEEEVWWKD